MVDGSCELGEVEYIQGAVIISLRNSVRLFHNIEHAAPVPQPLIHIDKCYPQHAIVTVNRHRAALDICEEFFSAHGGPVISR